MLGGTQYIDAGVHVTPGAQADARLGKEAVLVLRQAQQGSQRTGVVHRDERHGHHHAVKRQAHRFAGQRIQHIHRVIANDGGMVAAVAEECHPLLARLHQLRLVRGTGRAQVQLAEQDGDFGVRIQLLHL